MNAADFERAVCESMSESAWTAHVIALAQALGWRVVHFRPARTARGWRTAVQGDGTGFPDLVLVRGSDGRGGIVGRLLALELKSERARLMPTQQEWLALFAAVPGCEAYCLRPSDRERLIGILKRHPRTVEYDAMDDPENDTGEWTRYRTWRHYLCDDCYGVLEQGRHPFRVRSRKRGPCCRCGREHASGIWYRAAQETMGCGGDGPNHREES